jgi:alcohol dehydrogenase class IV
VVSYRVGSPPAPASRAFEFATAGRLVVGSGKLAEVPAALRALGVHSALCATNLPGSGVDRLRALLAPAGIETIPFFVHGEPTVDLVDAVSQHCRREGCDAVVGLGGGSALDLAKAVAAMATNQGELLDYLEVVGRGQPLQVRPLPCVAIPTTAGTGSEVTRNAVIGVPSAKVKVSLRSPMLLPILAVLDPDLLHGLPRPVVASSGLDALSHLVEAFVSSRANPMTDALAALGLACSARALRLAYTTGLGSGVAEDLQLASLCGGLCLANGGLGAVHGFAAPLGGMVSAPHGALCAALLAPVMEMNLRALAERSPEHPARSRYQELAEIVTGRRGAEADEGVAWVYDLCQVLDVKGLGSYGLSDGEIPALVAKAQAASSMRGNPTQLSDQELTETATRAL